MDLTLGLRVRFFCYLLPLLLPNRPVSKGDPESPPLDVDRCVIYAGSRCTLCMRLHSLTRCPSE